MLAVTTSFSAGQNQIEMAIKMSNELKIPYISRCRLSLKDLSDIYKVTTVIVIERQKISCMTSQGKFFFHPGMARLRIKAIKAGETDQMIKTMGLKPGYTVLDCTLGLGSDAIVSSYVTDSSGRVTGLESSKVIAALVNYGLKIYNDEDTDLVKAMRRIKVIHSNHLNYLTGLPDESFDVVYFDPMFKNTLGQSTNILVLRPLADLSPLTPDAILEAKRVARYRVVVKEKRNSEEFSRLGIINVFGGKYSPVAYGVIEK